MRYDTNTETTIHGFKVGEIVLSNVYNNKGIYEVVTYAEWIANDPFEYNYSLSDYIPVKAIQGSYWGYKNCGYTGIMPKYLERL